MNQELECKKCFSEILNTYIVCCKLGRNELSSRLRMANVSCSLFYDMQQSRTNPTFKNALKLAFVFNLSLKDTKDLLSRARLTFSPCLKFDTLIVEYLGTKHNISHYYDLSDVDIFLFDNCAELLFN